MKTTPFLRCGAMVLALLTPAGAIAQGVAIQHDEIGCIVAGKYPKMNACFAPASLVRKARVYFRPETLPTWYYVEMTSDAPCFSGVLLKPSKALIDKKIFYYVDVQGGGTGRTQEYGPVVVRSEEECRSKLIAPLSATGPAAVYPSFPAGFIGGGGVSSGVIAGGVAAAAVIGGGVVLLADDDDDGPSVTTPATVPVTNPPVTAPPVTTPPPPDRPGGLVVACQASPRSGDAPLRVEFATFPSGGTGTYEFSWAFGDGGSSTNPNPAHTFLSPGVFNATVLVTSGGLVAACSRSITVTTPPTAPPPPPTTIPPPTTLPPPPTLFKLRVALAGTGAGVVTGPGISCLPDCEEFHAPGSVVTLSATPTGTSVFTGWSGDCTGTGTCTVIMTADRNVTARFEALRTLTFLGGAGGSDIAGSVTSTPAGISCAWTPNTPAGCTDTGTFVNGTVVTLTVTTVGVRIVWGGACTGTTGNVCTVLMDADKQVSVDTFRNVTLDQKSPAAPVQWTSQLEVEGGEGHVVVNGRAASGVGSGLAGMAAEGRSGANRVEAALVRGGRPGTWRFDFTGQPGFRSGSLRVVAGSVAVMTGDAVVFRLRGTAGERVVFTFDLVAP